jgi:hypothetical protein
MSLAKDGLRQIEVIYDGNVSEIKKVSLESAFGNGVGQYSKLHR